MSGQTVRPNARPDVWLELLDVRLNAQPDVRLDVDPAGRPAGRPSERPAGRLGGRIRYTHFEFALTSVSVRNMDGRKSFGRTKNI